MPAPVAAVFLHLVRTAPLKATVKQESVNVLSEDIEMLEGVRKAQGLS